MKPKPIKKILSISLAAALIALSAAFFPGTAAGAEGAAQALPVAQRISVDGGGAVTVAAYSIADYTYYRLRDLSALLNGTPGHFSISYDAGKGEIDLASGADGQDTEFAKAPDSAAKTAASPSSMDIRLDGNPVTMTAYIINNYSYVKIRDFGAVMGIAVDYDGDSKTVLLDTPQDGAADVPVDAVPAVTPSPGPSEIPPPANADPSLQPGVTNGTYTFFNIDGDVLTLGIEKQAKIARIEMTSGDQTAECVSFRTLDGKSETLYDKNNVFNGYLFGPGKVECTFQMPDGFAPEKILIYETFDGGPVVYDIAAGAWE
ncbi:MAG: copper amine oxidase N-terminal domain-containing protein [Defluviitaleaceae bacterium]|nr:copper amine oxidase N-terminal domain-containing protein [Defluviitaleaceae bacterium]